MSDTLRVRCPNCNATGQEHVHSGEMYAGPVTCKLCNGARYVTVRKEAMSDTPDVIDTLFPDVRERPLMDLDGTTTYEPTRTLYTAESIRKILAAAGYVVVKADGLSHGDELVRLGTTWSSLTGPPPPPTYVLRRPVPENGDTQ